MRAGRSKTHPASSTVDIRVQFTPSPPCIPYLPCSSLQMAGERHRLSFGTLPGYSGAKSPQPGLTGAGPRQRQRVNGDGGVCRAEWEEGDCIAGSNGCKPAGDPEAIGVSRENPQRGKSLPAVLESLLAPGLGVQRGWHGTVGSAPCIQRGWMHGLARRASSSAKQLWAARAWHAAVQPRGTARHSWGQPKTPACSWAGSATGLCQLPAGLRTPNIGEHAGPWTKGSWDPKTQAPRTPKQGPGCKHPGTKPQHHR